MSERATLIPLESRLVMEFDRGYESGYAARATPNLTTDDLDNLYRLASAKRELQDIAGNLFHGKTSKRADRIDFSNRLYRVTASLATIEQRLGA